MFQVLLAHFKKLKNKITPQVTEPKVVELKEEVVVQATPEAVNNQITDSVTQAAVSEETPKSKKTRQSKKK